jgi:hypothetical protein
MFENEAWEQDINCGTVERTCQGKNGVWTIYDPSHNIESYKLRFVPYNKENRTVSRAKSWEFIPDGTEVYHNSYERLVDAMRAVHIFELRASKSA